MSARLIGLIIGDFTVGLDETVENRSVCAVHMLCLAGRVPLRVSLSRLARGQWTPRRRVHYRERRCRERCPEPRAGPQSTARQGAGGSRHRRPRPRPRAGYRNARTARPYMRTTCNFVGRPTPHADARGMQHRVARRDGRDQLRRGPRTTRELDLVLASPTSRSDSSTASSVVPTQTTTAPVQLDTNRGLMVQVYSSFQYVSRAVKSFF